MSAEDGFADVLNGLTLRGRGKRKMITSPLAEDPVELAWTSPCSAPVVTATDEDPADAAIVRPYAWTAGRTKSTMDLPLETMVSTSEHGENLDALTRTEHRCVAELCVEPTSVAEVATLLSVPLGVAKVLLGDMAKAGLVIVHKTATGGDNTAHLMLMERVLSGLRRL
ncbi:DUF742 domain-containing protein [Actinophytocola sp.]|uniref:DUF742 domain-containing protein n=1 Tax=Actinophytocola sp. TaxID=1872138 RepID=UPI002ED1AAA3